MAKWQKIVSRAKHKEPSKCTPETSKARIWVWRAGTDVTTLVLECGHKKAYRGSYVPARKALCKECES